MGPMLFLAPLLFVIEIIGHFVRPISLSLRLFGNMTGDHTVLGIFTDLGMQFFGAAEGAHPILQFLAGIPAILMPVPFYAL